MDVVTASGFADASPSGGDTGNLPSASLLSKLLLGCRTMLFVSRALGFVSRSKGGSSVVWRQLRLQLLMLLLYVGARRFREEGDSE